ncbi:protein of unknown function [Candidatus Promineifilum breve]|uniref:Uncharacterized protein n=1 Tax=Candidatus Promineifilum breve TaxID=1806508 RepID=A0A160T652_9CHLR|nr:hypothetical protein [Candidatus Promineifilum breve]CUS04240.2 protein of unknown function [Candidatus Promineifilum breve]
MARGIIPLNTPAAARTCVEPVDKAATATEFDKYLSNGNEFLVATNGHTAAINVIVRHPDEPNCIAFTCVVPPSEERILPKFGPEWRQADGYIYVDASAVTNLSYRLYSCDPTPSY